MNLRENALHLPAQSKCRHAMSYMIEVYLPEPQDFAREAQFTVMAEAAGGRLDYREDHYREDHLAHRPAVCLTYDFETFTSAVSIAEQLRRTGAHVEGPSEYGP